ncbi:UDP-N-acetyl-D-mannosamine dehydrogenase [Pseudaminobacter soli (ex Zhang et al. 2022)]|uniref:UDP-N-acetyl-D-mannosamine dehydrogenase n=1 Tax=Pseudaminobacter soli (ex Zhang et al. 2022) TaxID=2831468 RepID=UPI0016617CC8|nr:UDP-N-acetyl-D-mannosamine dehydrogenase [Pseudaminobacter soli]
MPNSSIGKTVSVVGLGYIGLPTATAFAEHGVDVIGLDVNQRAVETINRGEIHIVEPDLDQAVHRAVKSGKLRATLTPEPADAFLIAVPTPFKGADHEPDLSYIEKASRAIAPVLKHGDLVVLESTSPVGATEQMAVWLAEQRPDLSFPHQRGEQSDIRIAHCPERVLPGQVMRELIINDRIIGGMTRRCALAAKSLYKIFVKGDCVITDARTAEMCKLAENAFRDVNIAYANELSVICDQLGIDVWEMISLANRHPRVKILQPGAGVGGHCIAVDPWFIVAGAPNAAKLIRAAREVNDAKPGWLLAKVAAAEETFAKLRDGAKPIIAVLGLAFKPNIDDLRESPALHIAEALYQQHGERLIVVEPNIEALPGSLADARLVTLDQALHAADLLLVLVKHREFFELSEKTLPPDLQVIDAVGLRGPDGLPHVAHLRTLAAG